jgi:hypothetical protein
VLQKGVAKDFESFSKQMHALPPEPNSKIVMCCVLVVVQKIIAFGRKK